MPAKIFLMLILFSFACKTNTLQKQKIEFPLADKYVFSANLPQGADTSTQVAVWLYPIQRNRYLQLEGFYIIGILRETTPVDYHRGIKTYGVFSTQKDTLVLHKSVDMVHNNAVLSNIYAYQRTCAWHYMMESARVTAVKPCCFFNNLDAVEHNYDNVSFEISETKFLTVQTRKISKKEANGCKETKHTLQLLPLKSDKYFVQKYADNKGFYLEHFSRNFWELPLHQWHPCGEDKTRTKSAIYDIPTDTCQPPTNREIYDFLLKHSTHP